MNGLMNLKQIQKKKEIENDGHSEISTRRFSNNYFNTYYMLFLNRNKSYVDRRNGLCIVISSCIYILNKLFFIKYTSGKINCFCRSYLNDIICPFFFLGICQIILRWAEHEINSYRGLLFLGMGAGVVWEYIAPFINPKAVSDPCDLYCYFLGITVYYGVIRWRRR